MESSNQPPQSDKINIPDSSSADDLSPPPAHDLDLESDDSRSIEKDENKNNHLQHKTTAQENCTETANILLPHGDTVDKVLHNDEEQMDACTAEVQFDDFKSDHIEAQHVEVNTKPQSESKPQNETNKKCNKPADDGSDEIVTEIETKFRYKALQETEEEDLLKSDHEDESNENVTEGKKPSAARNSISLEQEEALLKSDDEEEDKYATDHAINEKANHIAKKSNANIKVNDYEHELKLENITYNLQNTQESKSIIHHESKIVKENVDLKVSEDEKNLTAFNHKPEQHYNQGSHCKESAEQKKSQIRTKNNAENHRILYQFDLDDDSSSSQESFPLENSTKLKQANETKATFTNQSPENNLIGTIETKEKEHSSTEAADGMTKENETEERCNETSETNNIEDDDSSGCSPKFTPSKSEEASSDSLIKPDKFESPPCSPKTEASLSDEDTSLDRDVVSVNEAKVTCSKLSASSIYNENKKIPFLHDTLSNNNDSYSNDRNFQDLSEGEDRACSFKLNGEHDLETVQSRDSNEVDFKNAEDTKVSASRKSSTEHSFGSSLPHQASLTNLSNEEKSQNSLQNDLQTENSVCTPSVSEANDDNDNQMEIGSDNESDIKSDEKITNYPNENVYTTNKTSFSLSPPPKTPHNDDEASRSSLASFTSYSSDTSSSQQLVIDHPMEDVKEEKVQPLKISLKRKLSYSTDGEASMASQRKHFHFNDENAEQENTQNLNANEAEVKGNPNEVSSLCLPHTKDTDQVELNESKSYENVPSEKESALNFYSTKTEDQVSVRIENQPMQSIFLIMFYNFRV